jgi:hypothetical protein
MGLAGFVLGAVALVFLFLTWIASANATDPMTLRKDELVHRLESACPSLPWASGGAEWVVKPVRGTNMGRGVDLERAEWTVERCERDFGVPCMRQRFHKGPWEVRMVRHDTEWDSSVAWIVPSEHDTPAALRVSFPWEAELQRCVAETLPEMRFVALDVRTNGCDIRVLEVNGSFGIPFQWTVGDVSFGTDMFRWLVTRAWEGAQHPERWLPRLVQYLANQIFKLRVRHKPSRFWF